MWSILFESKIIFISHPIRLKLALHIVFIFTLFVEKYHSILATYTYKIAQYVFHCKQMFVTAKGRVVIIKTCLYCLDTFKLTKTVIFYIFTLQTLDIQISTVLTLIRRRVKNAASDQGLHSLQCHNKPQLINTAPDKACTRNTNFDLKFLHQTLSTDHS